MRQPSENKARTAPPSLAGVDLVKTAAGTWRVDRNGATLASGLTFAQVTALIRGEVSIDALQGEAHGQG